ncbi:Right handed beta helix region [Rhizobium tibeticum]|uniref:Nitrous oxide reductase family maturation protein NosD n=1 Tax=Rhizobium tibeticum TaxID=501024 RepID=A0A1H8ILZ4_9HYPH|nr:nitrous oxide reductase family maturation protein NosD [Rhizobium tibeticum]SEN69016.1 Right handed beta helix region [Rhizobium tibeticum]
MAHGFLASFLVARMSVFCSCAAFAGASFAATIDVSPSPRHSIQAALNKAEPGDVIRLKPGVYYEDFKTVRNGKPGKPIVITGPRSAIVKGSGAPRVIEINHDYTVLRGFTVDGKVGAGNNKRSYRDKLIYVIGKARGDGVTGLRILNMSVKNAGGECIRLRYQTRRNEIAYSQINNCGRYDFAFNDGGKNGEGIYIGTAPEQRGAHGAPDRSVDASDANHVHHNVIDTKGNECVDIKEGSSRNIVEHNQCSGQKDKNSGGFDSRGNNNVFRYNTVSNVRGAGVRLGGDSDKDGLNNDVYGNTFRKVGVAVVRAERGPQGKVCGNTSQSNSERKEKKKGKVPVEPLAKC